MAPQSASNSVSRSPTRSTTQTSLSASESSGEYKWNSFEIRTLICLIIKGAHYDKKGPVDPMDFADKLNKALNPVKVSTQGSKALFDRDIPVDDVQRLLRRILARKSHAVDVVQRDPAVAVTKRQVNAFMRQLDFDGSESEWFDDHRREKVMVERVEMRRQLNKRNEGRPMSQKRWEDSQERLRDIESPRAQRLLSDWGMGRTFFKGEIFQQRGRWTQIDQSSRTTIPDPARGRSPTRRGGLSASPGGEGADISTTAYRGTGKGRHHDDPFGAYDSLGNNGTSAWDNSMTIVQTPAWGTPGNSLRSIAPTPNPPIGGWGGGFAQSAQTPQLNGAQGEGYGYAATPSIYGSSRVPASNCGSGEAHSAASPP